MKNGGFLKIILLVIEIKYLLLHCIVIGVVHVNLGLLTNDVPELFDRAHQEVLGFVWNVQDILDPLSFIGVEV
jgi:vacuolar-type H+-ATPase subunit I/STV1